MEILQRLRSWTRARLGRVGARFAKSRQRRAVREGYRLILLLTAAVALNLAFPVQAGPDLPVLQEGMIAREDVIAPIPFPVFKSEAELTRDRDAAASAVEPIFELRPEIIDTVIAQTAAFFDSLAVAKTTSVPPAFEQDSLEWQLRQREAREAAVRQLLEGRGISASAEAVALLETEEELAVLSGLLQRAFSRLLSGGVASELGSEVGRAIVLRSESGERLVPRDSVRTMQRFYEQALDRAPGRFGLAERRFYRALLIHFARPTLQLNREATEAARDQARQAVDPRKYEVLDGERIVGAHERVGPAEVEKLRALQSELAQTDSGQAWEPQLGALVYNLLLLIVFGLVLRFFRPPVYDSERSITLLWMLLLAVAVAAAMISRAEWPPQLIPVAFAALVVATLYDGLLALITVFVLVGLVAARPPLIGPAVFFPAVMGGAAAALSGRMIRRRAHIWPVAAFIATAYIVAASSLGLIGRLNLGWVLEASVWGGLNGVVCALVAAGVMPIAESLTRITTGQTLLELADLNRPVLRRLSLEAPGTYAHSVNVANLAEAAAREVGADSLLTRVGTYYHDIGKVKRPRYFVENQPRGRNPHDHLEPAKSAAIVRQHVQDGLELAEEARLPGAVKAFISEHHGTQKIGFFWEKAKEADPDGEPNPDDFRYPGPKPQSRETAILLLADSVESAARVLSDPTPQGIRQLVDRIVDHKMAERQLDESPLTMREISVAKQQFVKVLTGMYHNRLDYPLTDQLKSEAAPAIEGP